MKKILLAVTLVAALSSCGQRPEQNNVSIQSNTTAGFDVNKLASLVKTSTDPAVLEKEINNPANGINNLDLDKDGNIDYLKVAEPGQNQLNVVDDISSNQSVTVASINITPNNGNNTADLNIQGNPTYVGDNYRYHSSFGLTDFLLLSYLMRPHHYYVPMYHYGYYPSTYSRTRVITNYRTTTSPSMSSTRSYNRSSLGAPTRSQRSFSTRSSSSPVRSGGFGSSSSSSRRSSGFGSSSSSSRRSSGFGSSSSSRSFGSSRSGFGRRH